MFDPISSTLDDASERGAYLAFGNTAEHAEEVVLGRRGRGEEGGSAFCRVAGEGYVLIVPPNPGLSKASVCRAGLVSASGWQGVCARWACLNKLQFSPVIPHKVRQS